MGNEQQLDNKYIIQRQLKRMEINEKIIKNLISPSQQVTGRVNQENKMQKYSE
jgi:hypothetical protein